MPTITRKSRAEISKMRSAGRIVAEVLALVEEELQPGITTAELDHLAERHIRAAKGVPSFLNYLGGRRYDARDPHAYPASTCISVDNEIVHGIPGVREIRAGQIVSVDVGVIYDGWHGDGARSFICGGDAAGTPEAVGLVQATRVALMAGIAAAMPGNRIGHISAAVEDVASAGGYGIVRQYVGHGIGTAMHEDPQVPNFRSRSNGIELAPGICLAIEPMLTLGSDATDTLADNWTVVTHDGSLSAHFEHTIAVTANGPEILTTA
ncbi:MAG: type I methionyl aminopeptidase [Chloroflexi bacterium RBG_16_72_14]|nr:MAG: type I methionyl aminopeptidase [Chloroflexi bacterium RBG_16_72_14]